MALHQLLHLRLAQADAACPQFSPDARPARGPAALCMDGFDVDQQRLVTQMAERCHAGLAHEVILQARHAPAQHPALHRDGPHAPVALDDGVP